MAKHTVSIIQLVTPNIDQFAVFSIATVLNYAKQHGYSHQILREKLIGDMHINWTKIEYLRKKLLQSTSDFVLLIDADSLVIDPSISIDRLAKDSQHHIYMPQDTPFFSGLFRPNAGFILVRNGQKGREIISRWIDVAKNEGKPESDVHPRNQRVYWKFVMPHFRKHQKLLARKLFRKPIFNMLRTANGNFLVHYTSTDLDKRTQYMKASYEKYVGDNELLKSVKKKLNHDRLGTIDLS